MNMCKSKNKKRVGGSMPDIAKEERLAFLESRMKKNKEERLKATATFLEKTKLENKKTDGGNESSEEDSPKIESK